MTITPSGITQPRTGLSGMDDSWLFNPNNPNNASNPANQSVARAAAPSLQQPILQDPLAERTFGLRELKDTAGILSGIANNSKRERLRLQSAAELGGFQQRVGNDEMGAIGGVNTARVGMASNVNDNSTRLQISQNDLNARNKQQQYNKGTARVPGKDHGKDTVPAMLRPGEAVVTKEAMEQPGMRELVAGMNKKHQPPKSTLAHAEMMEGMTGVKHAAGGFQGEMLAGAIDPRFALADEAFMVDRQAAQQAVAQAARPQHIQGRLASIPVPPGQLQIGFDPSARTFSNLDPTGPAPDPNAGFRQRAESITRGLNTGTGPLRPAPVGTGTGPLRPAPVGFTGPQSRGYAVGKKAGAALRAGGAATAGLAGTALNLAGKVAGPAELIRALGESGGDERIRVDGADSDAPGYDEQGVLKKLGVGLQGAGLVAGDVATNVLDNAANTLRTVTPFVDTSKPLSSTNDAFRTWANTLQGVNAAPRSRVNDAFSPAQAPAPARSSTLDGAMKRFVADNEYQGLKNEWIAKGQVQPIDYARDSKAEANRMGLSNVAVLQRGDYGDQGGIVSGVNAKGQATMVGIGNADVQAREDARVARLNAGDVQSRSRLNNHMATLYGDRASGRQAQAQLNFEAKEANDLLEKQLTRKDASLATRTAANKALTERAEKNVTALMTHKPFAETKDDKGANAEKNLRFNHRVRGWMAQSPANAAWAEQASPAQIAAMLADLTDNNTLTNANDKVNSPWYFGPAQDSGRFANVDPGYGVEKQTIGGDRIMVKSGEQRLPAKVSTLSRGQNGAYDPVLEERLRHLAGWSN